MATNTGKRLSTKVPPTTVPKFRTRLMGTGRNAIRMSGKFIEQKTRWGALQRYETDKLPEVSSSMTDQCSCGQPLNHSVVFHQNGQKLKSCPKLFRAGWRSCVLSGRRIRI